MSIENIVREWVDRAKPYPDGGVPVSSEAAERVVMVAAADMEAARAALARIEAWSKLYGSTLCPGPGSADTFGDGMRAAKRQIASLLMMGHERSE